MTRWYSYEGLGAGSLSEVPCAVCGGRSVRAIGDDDGYRIVRCADGDCGFVYVSPRPSSEQLAALYATFYDGDTVVPDKWEHEMSAIFRECRRWLLEERATGSVLDVGCSFGHFLRDMEREGWRSVGIEPSPVAAAYAASLLAGTVLTSDFESSDLESGSFDAVVSLYVLEHVSDPRAFLEKVHRVLAPRGSAIIRIPYTAPLFPLQRLLRRPLMYAPMHLNDFSPDSFRRFARSVGFTSCDVRVGARRRAHDLVENVGARVLGGFGRAVEIATRGSWLFPLVGAVSYRLRK